MGSGCPVQHHGTTKALGCQHAGFGTFGNLFASPGPAYVFGDDLLTLLGSAGNLMHDLDRSSPDSPIPAGYTFFAQFIDHDITLDTISQLNKPGQEPSDIKNQRTPTLDLDCVYGLGPEAQPHLYDNTRDGFLATGTPQGRPWDLARTPTGVALIGDPRNDENIFVGQMQLLWIRFHNALMLSYMGLGGAPDRRFEEVQKIVRHHYQYIVLYDLLRRVCHPATYAFAINKIEQSAAERLELLKAGKKPTSKAYPLIFTHGGKCGLPMPVEFSVAAYRFGHTTVRDSYPCNATQIDIDLFDERFGTLGFSGLPEELAVDWRFQLEVDPTIDPVNTKAFDHLFPDELMVMPDPIVGRTSPNNRSLAFRNLVRGRSLGLASGERIAQDLQAHYPSVSVLTPAQLFDSSAFPGMEQKAKDAKKLAKDSGTPLFFYLMREAAIEGGCATLGPAGSAILLEVFGRMLLDCTTSFFFNREPDKSGEPGDYAPFEPLPPVVGDGQNQPSPGAKKHESRAHIQKHFHQRRSARRTKLNAPEPENERFDLELADIVRYVNAAHERFGIDSVGSASQP